MNRFPPSHEFNWNHSAWNSEPVRDFLSDGIAATRVSDSKDYWWEFKKSRQNYQRDLLVHYKDNRDGTWVLVGRESQNDRRDDTARIDTFYTEEDALKCIKHIMAGQSAASYCKQPRPLTKDELAAQAEAEANQKKGSIQRLAKLKDAAKATIIRESAMAAQYAKQQNAQPCVGKDFVTMGSDRIKISPDGKKITVYTNNSVELNDAKKAASKGTRISKDFNTAVLNGITIKRAADGCLVFSALKGTVLSTQPALEIGKPLADGWIYLGNNPKTGEDYSLEPAAKALDWGTWFEGQEHAAKLKKRGNKHAHLPTETEWSDILNKIIKGGKNDAAKLVAVKGDLASTYWGSSLDPSNEDFALIQSLSYGDTDYDPMGEIGASVRVVRSEPGLGP